MRPDDGQALLEQWLRDAGRTLQPAQRTEVLAKFTCTGLPLYLRLAFEAASRWKSYAPASVTALGADVPGVIGDLFSRLSADSNHGSLLVSRALGYLCASRLGLTEDEVLDLLSADEMVLDDFRQRAHHDPPARSLPVVVWSRLWFDVEPYLTERSHHGMILLDFYHRQIRDCVAATFLDGGARLHAHSHLADFFERQAPSGEPHTPTLPNVHRLLELPFQLFKAERSERLYQTLVDLGFVETKCSAGFVYDAIADYDMAAGAGTTPEQRHALTGWQSVLRRYGDVIHDHPALARNHLVYGLREEMDIGSEMGEPSEDAAPSSWLLVRVPTAVGRARGPRRWQRTLHHGPVTSLAVTRDGRWLASAGEDGGVYLWDAALPQDPVAFAKATDKRADIVYRAATTAVSGDGSIVVAATGASVDHLCWWERTDPTTPHVIGQASAVLGNPLIDATGALILVPPRLADLRFTIIDRLSGRSVAEIAAPPLRIGYPIPRYLIAASDDLRVVAVGVWREHALWLWDRRVPTSEVVHRIVVKEIASTAVSRSGSAIVVGTRRAEGTVKLLRTNDPDRWSVIGRHREDVRAVAISDDERWVATAGDDAMVALWDLNRIPPAQRSLAIREEDGFGLLQPVALDVSASRIFVASQAGTIYALDRTRWEPDHASESPSGEAKPEGHRVEASALDRQGEVLLWIDSARDVWAQTSRTGTANRVDRIQHFSASVAVSARGEVAAWIRGAREIALLWPDDHRMRPMPVKVEARWGVGELALREDGSLLAVGTEGSEIVLLEIHPGHLRECDRMTLSKAGAVRAIALSRDGSVVVVGTLGGSVWVWDRRRGATVERRAHGDMTTAVCVAGDGSVIGSGSGNGEVAMWGPDLSGERRATQVSSQRRVRALAMPESGRWLASVGSDEWLRLYDGRTGAFMSGVRCLNHQAHACRVAVDDARLYVVGSDPGAPRLYEVELRGDWR